MGVTAPSLRQSTIAGSFTWAGLMKVAPVSTRLARNNPLKENREIVVVCITCGSWFTGKIKSMVSESKVRATQLNVLCLMGLCLFGDPSDFVRYQN